MGDSLAVLLGAVGGGVGVVVVVAVVVVLAEGQKGLGTARQQSGHHVSG